jgi:hypothetical protein
MKKIYTILLGLVVLSSVANSSFAQGTCATAINLGTPGSSSSCQTFTSGSGTTGSSPCAGSGWGGNSWSIYYVTFCTNASNTCVNFDFSSTGGWSGNIGFSLYQGSASCGTPVSLGAVQGCNDGWLAGTGTSFSPTNNSGQVVTAPNTCYTLRIAFQSAPSAANPISMCVYTQPSATNDYPCGAMPIGPTSQITNNDPTCSYGGGTWQSDPAPGQFCAGSLENTAWYTFTTSPTCVAPCTVVVTLSNIVCSGGGSGFQIGYFTGSCGSLSNFGCTSGSGGTVTTTITGLSPGQQIIIGIDGNAGASCTFSISASNTVPLPVSLLDFHAKVLNNRAVQLVWSTSSETNSDFYTIEKSYDGINYEFVSKVKAAGMSNEVLSYNTLDNNTIEKTTYYRLKQTDFDGIFEYIGTTVVKGQSKGIDKVLMYPNPVQNQAEITLNSNNSSNAEIQIFDMKGKLIMSDMLYVTEGTNRFILNTESFNKGIYFVIFSNEFGSEKLKFIKE